MTGFLRIPPAGAPKGYGFVRPEARRQGGEGDLFVLASDVHHADSTHVSRDEWPSLEGRRVEVRGTEPGRNGGRRAIDVRLFEVESETADRSEDPDVDRWEMPWDGAEAAREPSSNGTGAGSSRFGDVPWMQPAGSTPPAPNADDWNRLVETITAAGKQATELGAANARRHLVEALNAARLSRRRAELKRTA